MKEINIHEILKIIPHRYPFLLVDRVLDIEPGKKIHAIKNVSVNEPFFAGHYPGLPIMPGVLILEALAQTAAIVFLTNEEIEKDENAVPIFAGVDNLRFKKVVEPGDQLHMKVEITRSRKPFCKMHAEAYVEDTLVCSADLITALKEPSQ